MTTQLWWVDPESFLDSPATLALLNTEERQRQQRFITPAKRHEFQITRVLVRCVLGKILGMPPETLKFVSNKWGRPALSLNSGKSPIYFNVSHTEGLIVILVSTEHEVGIDTELLSRAPTILSLASRVFAPDELSALSSLPIDEQEQRAVHLWTLKESYIKARGMGLALPLDGFAFHFDLAEKIRLEVRPELNDKAANWSFQTRMHGTHVISTAIGLPAHQASQQPQIKFCEFRIFC